MSGNNYTINSDNLFDDVDDEIYLNNASNSAIRVEAQNRDLQKTHREIENRTIESSKRTIQTLAETELMGASTAEELARQQKQLVRTNQHLDEITSNLSVSQKYINGIKSIFGGFKFFVSPQKDMPSKSSPLIVGNNNNDLKQGIYNQKSTTNLASSPEEYLPNDVGDNIRSQEQKPQRSIDEQLNSNLDVIAASVTRLKYLAKDIGQEIEASNELLDVIGEKMEIVDIRINEQNKEINSLLRKK